MYKSFPFAPELFPLLPFPPFSALKCFLNLKLKRVHILGLALNIIFPPLPPSPPSGPPFGTYFSLLKWDDPFPPLPEIRWILA